MKILLTSAIYESVARKGNKKFWRSFVLQDGDKYFTQAEYWQKTTSGEDSVHQFSEPYEARPKNVGRTNETTAYSQAVNEWNSIIKKQEDKGYHLEGHDPGKLPLPMLAQKFSERKHTLTWPVWVQPKYNGMRMLYDGEKGWSRGGKQIIPEVIQHLAFDTCGLITDGELILPNNPPLQETMTAAKKFRPGISDKLTYVVYDIIDEENFDIRYQLLWQLVNGCLDATKGLAPANVISAPTYICYDEAGVIAYHKTFVQAGYEGIMVRNAHEPYCIGQRSNQLQKYKTFQDEEFKIVGFKEGEGSYKGCICFICDNGYGDTFDCNPEGTIEYKKELWQRRKELLNQWLTVKFQEKSNSMKPIFPVGLAIRPEGF